MRHSMGVRPRLHRERYRRWGRLSAALSFALMLASALAAGTASSASTTVTVTPATIPLSDPELVNPMRGFYRWYGVEGIPQPRPSYDHYRRYSWRELEPSKDQYDFSAIERDMQAAQAAGAKFAFRVMSVNGFSASVEVPDYIRRDAGGAFCSYNGQSIWVPTWDHPQFIERARALVRALGARFNGDRRLAYYDLGLYGHWGEWHTGGLCTPPGSAATKRALVDMQLDAFPSTRTLMNSGGSEVDAFVYALNRSPRVGLRVDNLCDVWFDQQFTGSSAKLAAMQNRWQTAPIVSEFVGGSHPTIAQCDRQVRDWHIAAVGAGNFGAWSSYSADEQAQLQLLGKHAGYRIQLNGLSYPSEVTTGASFQIATRWSNVGVTPLYEPFVAVFELWPQGASSAAWVGVSQLNLERFLPTSQPQPISDSLILSRRLAPGWYDLRVAVRDFNGGRAPLALANTGQRAVGRYSLGQIFVSAGAPGYESFLPLLAR
jgi:hypothetical protein